MGMPLNFSAFLLANCEDNNLMQLDISKAFDESNQNQIQFLNVIVVLVTLR